MSTVPHTLRPGFAGRHPMAVRWVLLTCLAVLGLARRSTAGAPAQQPSCSTSALALCETLEPVIEAVTDGQPSKVQPAAAHAQAWWAVNRAAWVNAAAVDSAMRELKVQAVAHRTLRAARVAVMTATAALDACSDPPTVAAHMMRLDLAGMAGWLRAHGVEAPFPRNVERATQAISKALRAGGHGALAERLTKDVAATLAIPVRVNGNVRAANALMARVDEAELAAR